MKVYARCDANCKYETMTKEQILAAIAQAANGGLIFDVDAAFISQIKEKNGGTALTFWVGTQAEYNRIVGDPEPNCLYIIKDEATAADLARWVEQNFAKKDEVNAQMTAAAEIKITNGTGLLAEHLAGGVYLAVLDGNDIGMSFYSGVGYIADNEQIATSIMSAAGVQIKIASSGLSMSSVTCMYCPDNGSSSQVEYPVSGTMRLYKMGVLA